MSRKEGHGAEEKVSIVRRIMNSKQDPVRMIEGYIRYYNTRRVQRNLGTLTPMEKHKLYLAA